MTIEKLNHQNSANTIMLNVDKSDEVVPTNDRVVNVRDVKEQRDGTRDTTSVRSVAE